MRVEIYDDMAYVHRIDSDDLQLIGRWFARKAQLLMSADARMGDCRIHIWPESHDEIKLIPEYHREVRLTQEALLSLASSILEVSQLIGDQEDRLCSCGLNRNQPHPQHQAAA